MIVFLLNLLIAADRMPELPEVETTCRGITPHLLQHTITKVIIRQRRLRWPIPANLPAKLQGKMVFDVNRRGKYLLLQFDNGTLIIHLGMSGSLRILPNLVPVNKHDHIDLILEDSSCLRFNDPRRFGCILWTHKNPLLHPLLATLGPEPLANNFSGTYLYERSRKCRTAIKTFIMNSRIVVGVGNIYANEALFHAGIDPIRAAKTITEGQYKKLASAIKTVLKQAIKQGGTTLRNFVASDGKPGYFKQKLQVYGRGKSPCLKCHTALHEIRLAQRSTVFCPHCQH